MCAQDNLNFFVIIYRSTTNIVLICLRKPMSRIVIFVYLLLSFRGFELLSLESLIWKWTILKPEVKIVKNISFCCSKRWLCKVLNLYLNELRKWFSIKHRRKTKVVSTMLYGSFSVYVDLKNHLVMFDLVITGHWAPCVR